MTKTIKRSIAITAGVTSMFALVLWLLLFEKPTLMTPRFLQSAQSARHQNHYEDQLVSSEVNGQVRHVRRATVTESIDFFPTVNFEELVSIAESELTASRGWDLAAVPKDKVARFYQRTSNTTVAIYVRNDRSRATVSQTRFATPIDRFRNWWAKRF